MALISFPKLVISVVALLIARRVYWEATTGARRRAHAKQHGCQRPKRRKTRDPVLGIDGVLDNFKALRQHRVLEWWSNGLRENDVHTIAMRMLGTQFFITDDPENLKTALSTNFNRWSVGKDRIDMLVSIVGKGVFSTEGAEWKHSREMLRPCFERSQVADVSIFEKHTSALIKLIPKDGTTIDLEPILQKLTFDVATEFLFGRSIHTLDPSQDNKDAEEFVKAFQYCMNPLEDENNKKWGLLAAFLPDRKVKRMTKVVQAFADKMIADRIAEKDLQGSKDSASTRHVFLDEMLSETQDRTVIRSELLNIFLAGSDTTHGLLTNFFFEVSRHPDVLSRLRREISEYVGDGQPEYQHLKDMKYLKAVINEIQRLYPIVPVNARQAIENTTLPHGGGPSETSPIFIPKGTLVLYSIYGMHRRPDIYGEDADEFNPSRWLDNEHSSSPLRPGWGYLPFSGGPRVCIGQQFALTEVSYIVVRILQSFKELESRDDEPWREKLTIICSNLGGCKVALKN
jgi:cytochrome P450